MRTLITKLREVALFILAIALEKGKRSFIIRLISVYPLGRLIFRVSILHKKLTILTGGGSQRAVEYPWLLESIKIVKAGSLVLDVGCSESLLSHELVARGLRVVGLDIRDYPFRNKYIRFLRRNVMCTCLPANLFDAIIIISTIEHVGLDAYGQTVKDTMGDIIAMRELRRILKPGGYLFLTTPYVGSGPLRVTSFERNYNRSRLDELISGFGVVREDYFYPLKVNRRLVYVRVSRGLADKLPYSHAGVACLVLRK